MLKNYKIKINAPIEQAFSCFEDESKIRRWMGGQLETEFHTARDPQNPVGTKFTQRVKGLLELQGEVIAYQRPTLLGIGWKAKGLTGTIHYQLEEASAAETALTCDLEIYDAEEKHKLALSLLMPLFSMLMEMQLKGIKKIAEEG